MSLGTDRLCLCQHPEGVHATTGECMVNPPIDIRDAERTLKRLYQDLLPQHPQVRISIQPWAEPKGYALLVDYGDHTQRIEEIPCNCPRFAEIETDVNALLEDSRLAAHCALCGRGANPSLEVLYCSFHQRPCCRLCFHSGKC